MSTSSEEPKARRAMKRSRRNAIGHNVASSNTNNNTNKVTMANSNGKKDTVLCRLCRSDSSKFDVDLQLLESSNGGLMRAHYFCLLFSSGLHQKGDEEEGLKGFLAEDIRREIKRGNRLKCVYCKEKGATVGCAKAQCKKSYHLPCGIKNKSLQQHFDQFKSFCSAHRPVQKVPAAQVTRGEKRKSSHSEECPFCLKDIEPKSSFANLYAPCCKGWLHRACLQKSAVSTTEKQPLQPFCCPLCNDAKVFYQEMLQHGIYVPQQQNWEYDEDLVTTRQLKCSAKMCINEGQDGRIFSESDGIWKVLPCHGCRSKGIHIRCGGLDAFVDPLWYCYTCRRVVRHEEEKKKMLKPIQEIWGTASASLQVQKSVKEEMEEILESFRMYACSENVTITKKNPNDPPVIQTVNIPITTFLPDVQIIPVPTPTSFASAATTASNNGKDHMNVTLEDLIVKGLNSEYGRKALPFTNRSSSLTITATHPHQAAKESTNDTSRFEEVSPGDSDYESAHEVCNNSNNGIPFKIRKKSDSSKSTVLQAPETLDQKIKKTIKDFFHKTEVVAAN